MQDNYLVDQYWNRCDTCFEWNR